MNIPKQFIQTPLFRSRRAAALYGLDVFYKMECYQPSGSFKIRGMDEVMRGLSQQGHKKVIASSGGNAGFSLALVGKAMDMEVCLVVPESTSAYMLNKIRQAGATIEVHGESWAEADAFARSFSEEQQLPYVPPFDHPGLWRGHASMIDECAREMAEPDRIIVAVGGGGLLCGICEGMERQGWSGARIIAAETEGANSFARSLQAGKPVTLDRIDTIASSLGAKTVATKSLEYARQFNIESYVMDDRQAFQACASFADEYHVLVEPACGAALSYIDTHAASIDQGETTLVIVCGGVNMGVDRFNEYKALFA